MKKVNWIQHEYSEKIATYNGLKEMTEYTAKLL